MAFVRTDRRRVHSLIC
nr:unnamed protein product [Callosobruchus analis]